MRSLILFAFAIALGCSQQGIDTTVSPPVSTGTGTESAEAVENGSAVAPTAGFPLTPENTQIQFLATHVGPTPDPNARSGNFTEFVGQAVVEDDELKSIHVEIQMASVNTPFEKLTNHLQAPDFFDVREYPTAKFESTRIVRNEDGDHVITGNLTLLATTKEISFPARVGIADGQLTLSGKVQLDRSEFGMGKLLDKVNKEVDLTMLVGT